MPPELIGIIGLAILLGLIFLGVPIGINLMLVGFGGLWVLTSYKSSAIVLAARPFIESSGFGFVALPLFILMGEFALHGQIGEDAYNTAAKWLGKFPGGLAISTTAGCALFGAMSGSSLATNSLFSKIAFPEMIKRKYDVRLATGAIAASGTLAVLIPPSALLIIYGILTDTSIGDILIAGYFPGFLSALIYMTMIVVRVKINPELAPVIPDVVSWKVKLNSIGKLWGILIVITIMLGGIFLGVFTPTEGAAFGALGTLLIALLRRRLSIQRITESLTETMRITAIVFPILIGATVFTRFIALSQITSRLGDLMSGMPANWVMIFFLIVFGIMGMFLDPISMLSLGLPIFFPIVESLNISPVWFGILLVKSVELGGITPPLGINCYAVKAGVGDAVPLEDIFRGIIPFAIMDILTISIIFVFPSTATWLPNRIRG